MRATERSSTGGRKLRAISGLRGVNLTSREGETGRFCVQYILPFLMLRIPFACPATAYWIPSSRGLIGIGEVQR
jgi:hypothetical protein